jgi:hypothetical protein
MTKEGVTGKEVEDEKAKNDILVVWRAPVDSPG